MGTLSRREVLRQGAGAGGALAAVLAGQAVTASPASAATKFTCEVAPDLSTFDPVRTPAGADPFPTGPFYVQGSIYEDGTLNADGTVPPSAVPEGPFRCWGWIFDGATGAAVVSQSFEFAGAGDLQVQGLEDGKRAVTGGTGDFKSARGSVKVTFINPANLSFCATFSLI